MAEEAATPQLVSEFFEAAKAGDIQFLKVRCSILQSCPDTITYSNSQGNTVCHVALQHGHVEFALAAADIHPPLLWASNRLGDTPLHTAIKHGSPDFIIVDRSSGPFPFRDLIKRYWERKNPSFFCVSPTYVNREGKSLIYLAAEKGYEDVVSHLITLRHELRAVPEIARVDTVDGPNGSTALHVAVHEAKPAIMRILLEYKSWLSEQQDVYGQIPLHFAVTMNNPELVELLVEANAYSVNILNKDGISPFHLAASLGHLEIFKLILRLYPDDYLGTTNKGQNALHIAVQEKKASIVDSIVKDKKLSEYLINQQDEDGNTPLHVAASKGFDKMQNALLAGSAKVFPLKNALKERRSSEAMEDFQSSLLVMTTLITTVTFTAAFTLPGGSNGDEPNKGMATLVGRAGFDVFLVSNTVSMSSSIIATATLIHFSVVFSRQQRFYTLKMAIGALVISVMFLLLAFASGVWVVIGSQRRWLAIFIVIVIACTPLLLILLEWRIIFGSGNEDDD